MSIQLNFWTSYKIIIVLEIVVNEPTTNSFFFFIKKKKDKCLIWICHAFFGLPRSHNDINVLEQSSVFSNLAKGRAPPVNYSLNDHNYAMGYYLADDIYPIWATFVKTIHASQGNKRKNFAA